MLEGMDRRLSAVVTLDSRQWPGAVTVADENGGMPRYVWQHCFRRAAIGGRLVRLSGDAGKQEKRTTRRLRDVPEGGRSRGLQSSAPRVRTWHQPDNLTGRGAGRLGDASQPAPHCTSSYSVCTPSQLEALSDEQCCWTGTPRPHGAPVADGGGAVDQVADCADATRHGDPRRRPSAWVPDDRPGRVGVLSADVDRQVLAIITRVPAAARAVDVGVSRAR